MDFFNEDQLYQYFQEAIHRATSKEISVLEKELTTLRNDAYKQLTLSFEQRKNNAIKSIDDLLNIEYQKHLSHLEQSLNRSFSQYREELVAELIQKLKLRFEIYQKTTQYIENLTQVLNALDEKQIELVQVSSIDWSRIKINQNIKLVPDEKIVAGYRIQFAGGKRLIDETLDAKLIVAKNWFYQHATLQLEQKQKDEVEA